ncbi:ABC transporter ATP-binding protein [Leucobacter komagatae]|uniref:ABC transporter ATP-binding protein n=1 Tax=Leucobacter komagatae TaxID=55969 RepID=UPI0006972AD7|nr:ABC transporter ATP-binding protein [Leucobacter komagatae]
MTSVIALHGVTRAVGEAQILHGVDLEAREGEIVGLLGPNGAGKTTTVDLIAGLERPSSGSVTVLGVDPERQRSTITENVGVQPQAAALFPSLTVDETLRLFASFHDDPLPLAELRGRVGLTELRRTRVKHLSGGEERRLRIAIALVGRPTLVLLDEPSAGLDPEMRRDIAQLIREIRSAGATVLMTTHHLDEAQQLCDRVAIMARGRIVLAGSPDDLTRALVAPSQVCFTVAQDTDPELLTAAVGEQRTERALAAGKRITAPSDDPDATLRRLTFTRGLHATGVAVHHPTLEDVYLAAVEEPGAGSGERGAGHRGTGSGEPGRAARTTADG